MPGNEFGDRVHNFFGQEHVSEGQHHSQNADENWAAINNNFRVGNQRQFDALSSKTKDYNPQQSDLESAHNIQFRQVQHKFNSPSPTRADLANNRSHDQHQDVNGYIYGHQASQTGPEEAYLVGLGIESNRNNSIGRSFSINRQSQGSSPKHPATLMRMDSFESPVSYDFFGGQPKVSEHPNMRQSLPGQQSESSDMQQLMFRKITEIQRQKDFQQLHARQQNSVKQGPSFTGQVSGNRSYDFINGTPVSEASAWATERPTGKTNWLHHASSAMQGSPGGLVFTQGQSQASHSGNLVHKQVDQSLPGVPVSRMRDNLNQYQFAKNKSLQQMETYHNSFQGNNYVAFPEQVNIQEEHSNNRLGVQGHNLFGHTSYQGPSSRMNMENPEELSSLGRNVATQESQGKHELVGPSGMSPNKMVGQAPLSQNADALDPAEEKILFGSDDNSIWDAFGEKTDMNGEASNFLDGSEFMNGLPSIQSGSWSALMQSAVAETSSSDVGIQEDWTNLSIQNSDPPTPNQQFSTYDKGKRHTSVVGSNVPVSASTFEPVPLFGNTNLKNNHHNSSQGFLQSGQKMSRERIEGQQNNSSHRPVQQSSAGGNNWLNSGNQSYGSASHSVEADSDGRRYSNHWAPLQNGPSQPSKPNSWTATNGVTLNGDMPFDVHRKGNYAQNSQNGHKQMHESLNLKDGIWKVNPLINSSSELERLRSSTGSMLEGSSLNTAAVLNSTKSKVGEEANFLDRWKPMEAFAITKESEHSRKPERHLKNGPLLTESTFRSSVEVETHEMDTFSKKNHNGGHRSNVSNHNFTDGSRETDLSDASDCQSLASEKQKSSNPVSRKSVGTRKFQYHPMGNSDEDIEASYQMRHASHSKMMPLHNSEGFKSQDKGFFGQSKLIGQLPGGFVEKGKGQLPNHHEDANRLDEASFRGGLPGYGPKVSSAINKSVGMSASDKASHSSENMLELLHKVDQSKERIAVPVHRTSTGYIPIYQTPEAESSDDIGGCLQQNQSAAQGFGLQLAPPSQTGPGLYRFCSNPSQADNDSSSTQAFGIGGDQGQRMLNSTGLSQSLPAREEGEGEFKNTRTLPGQTAIGSSWHTVEEKFSSDSGFPCTSSQLQDQLMPKANGHAFLKTCIPQTTTTTGISQKGALPNVLSNIWPNVPSQQQFSGAQGRHTQPKPIQHHQSDTIESAIPVMQNLEDQGPSLVDDFPSEVGASSSHPQGLVCEKEMLGNNVSLQVSSGNKGSTLKVNESFGKDPGIQQLHCAPSLNPPSTQRDIEAFGRTLKPNSFVQQNFSFSNQIQVIKDVETDPTNRGSKRQKGTKNIHIKEQVASRSGQPYEADAIEEDAPFSSTSIPSEDPKMHHFSEQGDYGAINESENFRHGSSAAFIRTEPPNFSPHMAASWFNQYGNSKDGQMLQMHDAHKAVSLKAAEQPFKQSLNSLHAESLEHMNVASDISDINTRHPNENSALLAIENSPSLQILPPDNACEHIVLSRPKKRKFATFEIQSWQKEVSHSCQDLPSLRVAEANWAKAAKRLSEKVEDDGDTNRDWLPVPRARRRLSLTRQLMQLLIPAPPAMILSAEGSSNYETVAYCVARRALGDTCSLMTCLESYDSPSVQANLHNRKTSNNREQHTSQVMENFMGRVRNLETELLRLDKKASVSDLRMEVQDVEKISIINRFAMFHSRLQADVADTSSLHGAVVNSQKPIPQRYVTAVPLPKNLPESVQCLSL